MKTTYHFILLPVFFVSMILCCTEDNTSGSAPKAEKKLTLQTMASGLHIPWGMRYLPNGDFLFCERNGRMQLLKKGEDKPVPIATRQVEESEGGLLGLAIDPEFSSNHFIYVYETFKGKNRVVRLVLSGEKLSDEKVILDGIPAAHNHDGGALDFGPDKFLYVGTGDAQQPSLSQDLISLAGKILRIDRDGNPAPGNPFKTHIWSYGHRNVQGFDWNDQGKMLATEHGPSGEMARCCHDEVNLIEPGKNYGWPQYFGGREKGEFVPPVFETGLKTLAPSGCVFIRGKQWGDWENNFVLGALKGERLVRWHSTGDGTKLYSRKDTLNSKLGRLRNIIQAPDGALIFSSSNGDTADKIYRLSWE
jgi:glucose/arabinose dehydrogenase